jgi:hypothetical protein
MLPIYEEIIALTDQFSADHLNDEYRNLCRELVAALARKRPSPLERGKPTVWACGVIHALGTINFLFDPSQTPHVGATAIADYFGVGHSTGAAKSKDIRKMFNMGPFRHEWLLPSRVEQNSMIWMLSVNGYMIDIRMMPLEVQRQAFDQELIPYVPHYRLLEELEDHLPMTFHPAASIVPVLLEKVSGYCDGDDLNVTEVVDMDDDGGVGCGVMIGDMKDVVFISITALIPPPDHPLTPAIEQYRTIRSQALELGLLSGA